MTGACAQTARHKTTHCNAWPECTNQYEVIRKKKFCSRELFHSNDSLLLLLSCIIYIYLIHLGYLHVYLCILLSLFLGPACQQTDHRRDTVQGNHWLRGENPQRAGLYLLLEGQPGQRDPLLPHPSPQLRLQRQVQEDLPRRCGSKNTILALLRW